MSIENKINGKSLFLSLVKEKKPSKILLKKCLIFLNIIIKINKVARTIINELRTIQMLLSRKYKKLSSKKDSIIISYWSIQTIISIKIDIEISINLSAAIVPNVLPIGILLYSLNTVALTISPDLGTTMFEV